MVTRQSPIQHLLKTRGGEWTQVDGVDLALHFGDPVGESEVALDLGLSDISPLPMVGVKGSSASTWLCAQDVDVPVDIYETGKLADGGWIARIAKDEFLLASGPAGTSVPALTGALARAQDGVFRVARQDAAFLLTGVRAVDVFAQTCAVNMLQLPAGRLVMTRVAGVSCAILPWQRQGMAIYYIWTDTSYAVYLWETVHEIVAELGGQVVGAATVLEGFPEE